MFFGIHVSQGSIGSDMTLVENEKEGLLVCNIIAVNCVCLFIYFFLESLKFFFEGKKSYYQGCYFLTDSTLKKKRCQQCHLFCETNY